MRSRAALPQMFAPWVTTLATSEQYLPWEEMCVILVIYGTISSCWIIFKYAKWDCMLGNQGTHCYCYSFNFYSFFFCNSLLISLWETMTPLILLWMALSPKVSFLLLVKASHDYLEQSWFSLPEIWLLYKVKIYGWFDFTVWYRADDTAQRYSACLVVQSTRYPRFNPQYHGSVLKRMVISACSFIFSEVYPLSLIFESVN